MRVFLDTEFNGFGGSLLSLALVTENDTDPYFYKKYDLPEHMTIHPWVEQHVMPYMDVYPEGYYSNIDDYLGYICTINNEDSIEVIADWPEDISHMCQILMPTLGYMVNLECSLSFHLEPEMCSGPYQPMYSHNALSDAMANRMNYSYHLDSDEEE